MRPTPFRGRKWRKALERKSRKKQQRILARIGKENNERGLRLHECAAAALKSLVESGKILKLWEFAPHSHEDRMGWDLLVLMPDMGFVPIDVTINSRSSLERKFDPREQRSRWRRLILPLDFTDPAMPQKRLAQKIFPLLRSYEPRLSLEELKRLVPGFDIEPEDPST